MKLSRLLDQEDAVYAVISLVKQDLAQGNRVHLDGMLYALGCLCRSMDFIENEELVEVILLSCSHSPAVIELLRASPDIRYHAVDASPHSSSRPCHYHHSLSL